jgi:hypothetical protein
MEKKEEWQTNLSTSWRKFRTCHKWPILIQIHLLLSSKLWNWWIHKLTHKLINWYNNLKNWRQTDWLMSQWEV